MYNNKKIFVLGMARSGYEVAKLLSDYTKHIIVVDGKEQDLDKVKELENLGIEVVITNNQEELLDATYDYVVKNPGIKLDNPTVLKAEEFNIPVINELEVAYHLLPKNIKIVGITGSNGKTTTTTIIYELLKKGGIKAHLGGNIGYPVSSLVKEVKEGDTLVLEISGHQLHDMYDFKTDIGVITNLSEVHLDHFGTFENYKYYKSQILRHHTKKDLAIINGNDENVLEVVKNFESKTITFSSNIKNDLYLKDDTIYYFDESIIETKDIILKGNHNYENMMCGIAVAKEYNIPTSTIKKVLSNFKGVEHRIEFVKEINGRKFYNDSKATNVKSTEIALNSFNNPTILLLGGLDRGHSFEELVPFMKNVKEVVCYGETRYRISEFCDRNKFKCHVVDTLEEATKLAYNDSNEGDIILLSPACASWDQFESFEKRGELYKQVINSL